jgi:hypothetical protein
VRFIILALICTFLMAIPGCVVAPRYNSLDLAMLPCDSSSDPIFFPVEFRPDGIPLFPDQVANLQQQLDPRGFRRPSDPDRVID